MNHSLVAVMTGDLSGREAMDSPEDDPDTTVWCSSGFGCVPYIETAEGRERYEELKPRYYAWEDAQKGETCHM